MQFRPILFLSIFLLSLAACNEQTQEQPQQAPVNIADVKFAETKIALVGEARQEANNWIEYTKFETALENYDHSDVATQQLATLVKNMRETIPANLDNQAIKSRLLVLETRIKSYQSFLNYNSKTKEQYTSYFNAFTTALDQLRGQLNEKLEIDRQTTELIEELKNDLRDLNASPTDSVS